MIVQTRSHTNECHIHKNVEVSPVVREDDFMKFCMNCTNQCKSFFMLLQVGMHVEPFLVYSSVYLQILEQVGHNRPKNSNREHSMLNSALVFDI